jgi:hypothetical protein
MNTFLTLVFSILFATSLIASFDVITLFFKDKNSEQ